MVRRLFLEDRIKGRLTRSLADFAKLFELFDANGRPAHTYRSRVGISGRCVADETVAREPVSGGDSLLSGKITGNFVNLGLPKPIFASSCGANSKRCEEIPCAAEQGTRKTVTENFSFRTGNLEN